ncbi:MAG: hypothetical protein QOE23_2245 [Pseudonocardiales bacterium]|jgi:hypothetical protein|nr:hypothetical protein [Pseudonocardiales bacterium]
MFYVANMRQKPGTHREARDVFIVEVRTAREVA